MTRALVLAVAALALTGAGYGDALRAARDSAGARQMAGAVVSHGELVWAGALGHGDAYSLASLTKPFTATVVLRLAEEGALSLDDPIGRWLAGTIPQAAEEVTVRELLAHTSGLPDYLDHPSVAAAFADPRHRWTEAELLAAVRPPQRRGRYAYSNTNYVLLGAIARRASGLSMQAALRRHVLAPLGLGATSFTRTPSLARRVAGGRRLPNDVWGPLWGDGGIVSTAGDVARFLHALVAGDGLLTPPTRTLMLRDGLGVYGADILGEPFYGHDGSYGGWLTLAMSAPRADLTVAVLAHGGRGTGPSRGVHALVAEARRRGLFP